MAEYVFKSDRIGTRIASIRKKGGFSQQTLADEMASISGELKVNRGVINSYESGRANPTLKFIELFVTILPSHAGRSGDYRNLIEGSTNEVNKEIIRKYNSRLEFRDILWDKNRDISLQSVVPNDWRPPGEPPPEEQKESGPKAASAEHLKLENESLKRENDFLRAELERLRAANAQRAAKADNDV